MNHPDNESKHIVINFNEKIETQDGTQPLWALGTIDIGTNPVFHIDGYFEDHIQQIFAINKDDQSVYVYKNLIGGHKCTELDEESGMVDEGFKGGRRVALERMQFLINSGKSLIHCPENASELRQNYCIPVFLPLEEVEEEVREMLMDTLMKDGGISLLKSGTYATCAVTVDYKDPDPTLLAAYSEAPPAPAPELKKPSRVFDDNSIPF